MSVNVGCDKKLASTGAAVAKNNPESRLSTSESPPVSVAGTEPNTIRTIDSDVPHVDRKVPKIASKETKSPIAKTPTDTLSKSPKESMGHFAKTNNERQPYDSTNYKLLSELRKPIAGDATKNSTIIDYKTISTQQTLRAGDNQAKVTKQADETSFYKVAESKRSLFVASKSPPLTKSPPSHDYENLEPLKNTDDDSHYVTLKVPAQKGKQNNDEEANHRQKTGKKSKYYCLKISLVAVVLIILIVALVLGIYFGFFQS